METSPQITAEQKTGLSLLPGSWRGWLAVCVLAAAIFFPRFLGLVQYVTPDEHLWLTRSANFYYALSHLDFTNTYQRQHPGVTIMWAGALGFIWQYPLYRGTGLGQINYTTLERYLRNNQASVTALDLLVAGRTVVVAGQTLVLLLAYLCAVPLIGFGPAFLGFLLIAFDPFHVALTRLLHLDGLLADLMLLSLLAYLHFSRSRRIWSLALSGAAAGLSWLTKSPGFILVPVVGLLALFEMWKNRASFHRHSWARLSWKHLWPPVAWGLVGVVTFVALWPAMWVAPLNMLRRVFSMATTYAEEGHSSPVFFDGTVFSEGGIGPEYLQFYPLTYLWRSTPTTLIGLGLFLAAALVWRKAARQGHASQTAAGYTVGSLLLMCLIFWLVMDVGSKKFDRYLLPVYPPLELLAGMGWWAAASWLAQRVSGPMTGGWRRALTPLLLVVAVAAHGWLTAATYPYYLSYYNPLLGGGAQATKVMQIGWGEGLDQAARYLNQKPNRDNLRIFSWYAIGSFSYFFQGKSNYIHASEDIKENQWKQVLNANYAVIYVHQWQRQTPRRLLEYLQDKTPEYTVWINGIEYVRIYNLKEGN
jgi:4-amino-4-deoxy-L-arabinose transferase-like glycosyltransferase